VQWLLLVRPAGSVWVVLAVCLLAILPACGSVGGFTDDWTSNRSIAPATGCWS
jgi:hypothetical protein